MWANSYRLVHELITLNIQYSPLYYRLTSTVTIRTIPRHRNAQFRSGIVENLGGET